MTEHESSSSSGKVLKTQQKKRKIKRAKSDGPPPPKRPANPFQIFCASERPKVLASPQFTGRPGSAEERKRQFADLSKLLGQRWAQLPQEEKQEYVTQSAELRKSYDEEVKNHSEQWGSMPVKKGGLAPAVPVEPYYFFLFQHWQSSALEHPSLDGGQLQQLLWRTWQITLGNGVKAGPVTKEEVKDAEQKLEEKAFQLFVEFFVGELRKVQPEFQEIEEVVRELWGRWERLQGEEKNQWLLKASKGM